MQPIDLLLNLRNHFSATTAQRIIPVLRRDPLVWTALQEDATFQKMMAFAGDEPAKWSPAWVGLVAVCDPVAPEATLEILIAQALRSTTALSGLLDSARKTVLQPRSLREAIILALALQKRVERFDPSRSLLMEILPQPSEAEHPAYLAWQTPLACLLGLARDPLEVLRSLMPKRTSPLVMQWVTHAVFSNPFEEERKVEIFTALLDSLPPSQQLNWLRQINLNDGNTLVVEVATRLLSKTSINNAQLMGKINLEQLDLESAIVRCMELQRLAGLYRYANQPSNARGMLQKAQSIVKHWSAGLTLQDFDLAQQENASEIALDRLFPALAANGSTNGMQSEILLSVPQTSQAESLVEQLSDHTTNPISQIFLASRIARSGEVDFAREMAGRAVELWLQQVTRQSLPFTPQFAMDWHPQVLIQALVDLQLNQQAVIVAARLEEIRPNDPGMSLMLSKICDQIGDTQQAVAFAQLKVAMTPQDSQSHAWLSVLWGKSGKWELAYQEQQQAIFLKSQLLAEDWAALANCAVELQDWPKVEESADQALRINPDLGIAMTMKGLAYLETDRMEEAGHLLSRATLLSPEEPDTWLQLAKLYNRNRNRQRALETLRAAVLAVPTSAEVNFELARVCLENGLTSDALPYLRRAAALDSARVEIAVDLGRTLRVLGYVDESLKVLEQARLRWPQHPNLAYTHAQTALVVGSRDVALAALEVALETGTPEFDWYILFARTILGKNGARIVVDATDFSWVTKAEQVLEKALALRPDDYEASLLQAEVVFKKGAYLRAYELYETLMDRPEFRSTEFRWRVQAGLGQVALKLKYYESALASLQEAVQDQPENVLLHHSLAEAYSLSRLDKQAVATARTALRLAPDDLNNLVWFADLMAKTGEPQEAIQALRTATQLAPDSAIFWLKMAELTRTLGDTTAAQVHLKQLLGLSNLARENLYQAAQIYSALNEPGMVLECLNRIANPDTGIDLEIAYFAIRTHQLENGLRAIQDAVQKDPDQVAVYVLQAELLNGLNRPEAGLACLEHALQLVEAHSQGEGEKWQAEITSELIPRPWLEYLGTENIIHDHLAKLFRQMGDFASAMHHAEELLERTPESFVARVQAAEICEALLLTDHLGKILDGISTVHREEEGILAGAPGEALAQLWTMRAELALESGNLSEAVRLAALAEELSAALPRLLALRARLAVNDGEWQKALDWLGRCPTGTGVWSGKAALELYRWDAGLSWLENLANRHPADLNAQHWFAVGLAKAALARKIGQLLGVTAHLPGEYVGSDKAREQFERASTAAVKSGSREALRWQMMGRAIFQPGIQTIRSLAAVLPGIPEAAVLTAVLRETKNISGAIQVAEQYQDAPEVMFQWALCALGTGESQGLEVARKAIALRSSDPLYHVVGAKLSQSAGLQSEALSGLETAIKMWPDEPEWHIWASQLAVHLERSEQVIEHWDRALKLVSRRAPYVILAGKDYLTYHQEQKAIRLLEDAAQEDPANAEIWYWLGTAFDQAGQLKRALLCAEKAAELDAGTSAPALLCGEICLRLGNGDGALAWGRKAVMLDESNLDAVLFIAYVFEQRHNLQEALQVIQKALSRNLASLELLLERARLVFILQGGAMALPLLKDVNVAYPQEAMVLKLLAQAEMETGNIQQAEQIAFQALRLDPEQPALTLLMGKLQRLSGQLDQSIHYLSETIRQAPALVDAYLELGLAYMDRREFGQALQVYQKAMKAIPQDFRPYYQAGLILREAKDYHGAETMLRRAAELAPEDLNIRRQLGAVITLNLIHSSQEASSNHEPQRSPRY